MLQLKNITKDYLAGDSTVHALKGVEVSFRDREFVAILGPSGCGKTTLLNLIGGLDQYTSGDLLISGRSTKEFRDRDWDSYRNHSVGFVFQSYNLIPHQTVLQNVELALMSIPDRKQRRARAVELLTRVGLGDRLHQKGAQLSGGQKQRTVIARALAKDSPIILADEPTGNLDSVSGKEIMELLREVSRDKLLIVVTHNLQEVEDYATREVRIFDGAVAWDHTLRETVNADGPDTPAEADEEAPLTREQKRLKRQQERKNGWTLGKALFTAMPKLTLFLCLLFTVGALGIFAVTGACGEIPTLLKPATMFNYHEGRLVLTRADGKVPEEGEMEALKTRLGAESMMRYDYILDAEYEDYNTNAYLPSEGAYGAAIPMLAVRGKDYGDRILGRYPEKADECLLYLAIGLQPRFGRTALQQETICYQRTVFKVVGVKYYYDNNLENEILLTEEAFGNIGSAYFANHATQGHGAVMKRKGSMPEELSVGELLLCYDLPKDCVYVGNPLVREAVKNTAEGELELAVTVNISYSQGMTENRQVKGSFGNAEVLRQTDVPLTEYNRENGDFLAMHPQTLQKLFEENMRKQYRQTSLFFKTDGEAARAAEGLRQMGYIGVTSDTRYTPSLLDTIANTVAAIALLVLWGLTVVFLAFFVRICSGKAVGAFKKDLAILRSMGISVRTVALGFFARFYLCLLPALLILAAAAFLIFRSPMLNERLTFLYPWQYLLLVLGMLIMTTRVGLRHLRTLFGESVRASLRGGDAE